MSVKILLAQKQWQSVEEGRNKEQKKNLTCGYVKREVEIHAKRWAAASYASNSVE